MSNYVKTGDWVIRPGPGWETYGLGIVQKTGFREEKHPRPDPFMGKAGETLTWMEATIHFSEWTERPADRRVVILPVGDLLRIGSDIVSAIGWLESNTYRAESARG